MPVAILHKTMSSTRRPTAVVTGASSGIGAALCRYLLSNHWEVCMIARSKSKMEEIAKIYPSELPKIIVADLSINEQAKDICPEIISWCDNNLSLLVNNAGMGVKGLSTQNCEIDQFESQLRLNLTSIFILTKYLLPALKEGNRNRRHSNYDSSIINIGSVAGSQVHPIFTPYCVAKCALEHLTKLHCLEFASFGIRVNCIAPATVITNWMKASGSTDKEVEKYYKDSHALHPIGRCGTVKDLVDMIMFLADGSKTGWMTGQVITLDGGRNHISIMPSPDKKKSKL